MDHVSSPQCRYCACPTPGATCSEASPPAAPEANDMKSLLQVPHLLTHLQLILVPLDQCTSLLLTIRFIWLGSVTKTSLPYLRRRIIIIYGCIIACQVTSVGVRTSSRLRGISKKLELKSMIISRVCPHDLVPDSEKFMYGNLKHYLHQVSTKIYYYSHFYASVTTDGFRLVNDRGAFLEGALNPLLFPEQVLVLECLDKPAETQTMLDPLLLLTLPVTVPQNTHSFH
jgi:hypothetical protein